MAGTLWARPIEHFSLNIHFVRKTGERVAGVVPLVIELKYAASRAH